MSKLNSPENIQLLRAAFLRSFSNMRAIQQPMFGSPRYPTVIPETTKIKPSSKPKINFRGSALPICLVDQVFRVMLWELAEKPLTEKGLDPYSDYFFSEGTLIHQLLQRWLGYAGLLYGKYECQYCGKKQGPQLGAKPCCYHPMEYQEFSFHMPSDFTYHPDLILHFHGLYGLGDIKTSKFAWAKDFTPPAEYVHQLNSYYWNLRNPKTSLAYKTGMLPEGRDFDVVFLLFVPRDYYCLDPSRWRIYPITPDKQMWLDDLATYRLAKKCVKTKDERIVLEHPKCSCEDQNGYSKCWMESMCFSSNREKMIQEYFEHWRKQK